MGSRGWTKWQRLGVVALVGGGLLVAACGSGDFDNSTSSSGEFDRAGAEAPGAPVDETSDQSAEEPGGGGSLEQPQVQDRKIVRNAMLELQVENVVEAVQQIDDIAAASGGFVSSSNVFVDSDENGDSRVQRTQTASVTIRVPADAYSSVMGQLRGIAKETVSETSDASEVTEEYTDLQARQRNLEATEARYLDLLSKAASIDEILTVQDRLNQVRLEIEQVTGRINVLNSLTDFATITARLSIPPAITQRGDSQNWAEEAWQASWEVSHGAMVALGTIAIVSGVLLAWLAIPALVLFVVWRLFGRRIADFAKGLGTTQPAIKSE
jgi:Domain of unknown function (DUF4349)